MKRHSLDIPGDDIFDFDILGIACTESHYRVVYEINALLDTALVLESYLEYTHREGQEFLFPLYQCRNEELNIEYNLVPNQTSYQPPRARHAGLPADLFAGEVEASARLLPELDNTDYFFLLKGVNRYMYYHRVLEQLKKSPLFMVVQEIFVEEIRDKKSRGNLLF